MYALETETVSKIGLLDHFSPTQTNYNTVTCANIKWNNTDDYQARREISGINCKP